MSEVKLKPGWLKQELDAAYLACAPPAAGPWIKIEPGCEMPELRAAVLLADARQVAVGYWTEAGWYSNGRSRDYPAAPAHYAIINQPED